MRSLTAQYVHRMIDDGVERCEGVVHTLWRSGKIHDERRASDSGNPAGQGGARKSIERLRADILGNSIRVALEDRAQRREPGVRIREMVEHAGADDQIELAVEIARAPAAFARLNA